MISSSISPTWAHRLASEHKDAKSRLCPRGFEQIEGLHYDKDEVAAATPHLETVMLYSMIQVKRNQFSRLLDAVKAFSSYGKLTKRVLMKFPPGMKKIPGFALQLHNSLQGLKQGAHDWQIEAIKVLEGMSFRQSKIDPCYWSKWIDGNFCQILVSTDDFKISCDLDEDLNQVSDYLESKFKMTKGDGSRWIGLNVRHDRNAGVLTLSAEDYIASMLKEFDMVNCKPVDTPHAPNVHLLKAEDILDEEAAKFDYRGCVGQLLWIARTCRPDIRYAINCLSRHVANWDMSHVRAAKRVLRYLKGTNAMMLT